MQHVPQELAFLQIASDRLKAHGNFEADSSHSLIWGLPPHKSERTEIIGDMLAKIVGELHQAVIRAR